MRRIAASILATIPTIAGSLLVLIALQRALPGQEAGQPQVVATPETDDADVAPVKPRPPAPKLPEPKDAQRLSPDFDVWIDSKQKAVLVDGQISLREGMLEMLPVREIPRNMNRSSRQTQRRSSCMRRC
jgi:hypothetical protein